MNRLVKLISPAFFTLQVDVSLFVFRILLSASLINTHGIKKVLNFEETIQHIPDPIGIGSELSAYIAVFSNIVSPVFIILGLFTRPFIIPIISTTLIGFFIVHSNDPWAVRDIPFMYSLAFLLLFVLGPGKYSLDAYIAKKYLNA